jgi:hypothetical protein
LLRFKLRKNLTISGGKPAKADRVLFNVATSPI